MGSTAIETRAEKTATPNKGAGAPPSVAPGNVQKKELRGKSFAEGEAALAPVQAKRSPGGNVQKEDAPAPTLSDEQRGGLKEVLPLLSLAVDAKDGAFVQSLAEVGQSTKALLDTGTSEDLGFSLWLNWVVMLPKQTWLGDTDPTLHQVMCLDIFEAIGNDRLAKEGKNAKLEGFIARAKAMRSFYASMLKGVAKPGDTPEQTPVTSTRQAVVGLALAQLGKVHSGQETDTDEQGRPARRGWRTLKNIYDAAWGGKFPNEDIIKHKRVGPVLKHGSKKGDDGKYAASDYEQADQLPSWCGIFPTAMVKSAGMGIPAWDGGGVNSLPVLQPPDVPRPGDIVNKVKNNHFGIITWVGELPETRTMATLKKVSIKTVEGNTDGGQIAEHSSTLGSWDQGGWGIRQLEPSAQQKKK